MVRQCINRLNRKLRETYHKAIKYAQTPIQFYAAIILVLGGLVGTLAWLSVLPPKLTMWVICICMFIIVGIVLWVSYLLTSNPSKLVLGKEEYIIMMREKLGDSTRGERYYTIDMVQTETPQIKKGDEGK